jgi:hypothetical protein
MKAAANPYLWGTYPQTAWANGWHDEDKRLAAEAGPADDMARADGLGA